MKETAKFERTWLKTRAKTAKPSIFVRLPPLARRANVVVAATLALVAAAPAATAKPSDAEHALMRAVNDARTSHGLRPVRVRPRLQRESQDFADYLRRNDSFYHSGVPDTYENLAFGPLTRGMARNVVRRWMDSPGHRENILRRGMRFAGFGVSRGEFLGYSGMQISVVRFRG